MATIAITGVGGLVGRRLLAELEGDASVDRILGLDVVVPEGLPGDRLELRQADIRDPGLAGTLEGVDTVVHLAFQLDPDRDEAHMWDVNVAGSRNVFECAHRAGAGKVIYVSSGVAYGAHPDNDVPLTEESPLRANPDFNYAEHKFEVEQWLWPWAEEHPETVVTVLRPSIITGHGAQNFITRQFEMPRFPSVRGHKPPMQFAHVDDVASALAHVIRNDLPGPYNVTSEGWLSFDEITAIAGRGTLDLPEEVAFQAADRMWRMGLGEAPAGQVHYIMHPWVMSVDKLVATGWRPKHSNRDAFAELVEEHRDWVSVAGIRTRRSTVRNALVGATAVGLVGLVLWRRRSDDG